MVVVYLMLAEIQRGGSLTRSATSEGSAEPAGLGPEDLKRLLDLSCSISAGLGVDDYREKVLTLLLGMFSSDAGNFFIANHDARGLNLSNVLTHRVEDRWLKAFEERYQYLDPYLQRPLDHVGVTVLDEIVDRERFERSAYYNEFLKPQGIHREIAISLSVGQRIVGLIALFRPRTKPNFTPADKQKAVLMVPYLANGLERALIFEHTRQKNWILESSLRGKGGPGMLILDRDMKTVFLNEEAEALLRGEEFSLDGAGLRLPEKLAEACTRATRDLPALALAPEPEEVSWLGPADRSICARLTVISGHFLGQPEHFLVVKLGERYGKRSTFSGGLAEQYQLTPREVEVVGEVVKGSSNVEIAENLFISVYTVENHLKRIFRKMGVRNRTELSYKLVE